MILSLSSKVVWPGPIDLGGSEVVQALVAAPVLVVLDEGLDAGLKRTRQRVVFQHDPLSHSSRGL